MVLPERYELKDEQWNRIEALFPVYRTGQPPKLANQTVLNAILWLLHSGAPWQIYLNVMGLGKQFMVASYLD